MQCVSQASVSSIPSALYIGGYVLGGKSGGSAPVIASEDWGHSHHHNRYSHKSHLTVYHQVLRRKDFAFSLACGLKPPLARKSSPTERLNTRTKHHSRAHKQGNIESTTISFPLVSINPHSDPFIIQSGFFPSDLATITWNRSCTSSSSHR